MVNDPSLGKAKFQRFLVFDKLILAAVALVPLALYLRNAGGPASTLFQVLYFLMGGITSVIQGSLNTAIIVWLAFSYPMLINRPFKTWGKAAAIGAVSVLIAVLFSTLNYLIYGVGWSMIKMMWWRIAVERAGWLVMVVLLGMIVSRRLGIHLQDGAGTEPTPKRRPLSILDLLLVTTICAVALGITRAIAGSIPNLADAPSLGTTLIMMAIANVLLYLAVLTGLIHFQERSLWIKIPVAASLYFVGILMQRIWIFGSQSTPGVTVNLLMILSIAQSALTSVVGIYLGLVILRRLGFHIRRGQLKLTGYESESHSSLS